MIDENSAFREMLLDCLACKWSLRLMQEIDNGVNRPGQLVRQIDGLSTKVMNESLQRLIDYQVLVKKVFDQKPLRVEYELTPFGREVLEALQSLSALQLKYSALLSPDL